MPEQRVGTVTHYFGHLKVAIVKLDAPLHVGETVKAKGVHDDFTFRVDSMQVDHANIPEARKGQEVGIKVPEKAHEGTVVYRAAAS